MTNMDRCHQTYPWTEILDKRILKPAAGDVTLYSATEDDVIYLFLYKI